MAGSDGGDGGGGAGNTGSGSLFTTTFVFTSHGHVYTSTSTGILGTGKPVPHDFAHNVGAIVGVAIACVVFLVFLVLGIFWACARYHPRKHREFLLYGPAKGLRRSRGAWRSPIDGDSIYSQSLMSETGESHNHRTTDEDEMSSFVHVETPDLISWQHEEGDPFSDSHAVYLPIQPSSLSIPTILAAAAQQQIMSRSTTIRTPTPSQMGSAPGTPRSSSLLNPPPLPSSSASTLILPPPGPTPEWPGLRSSIAQAGARSSPLAAPPTPPTPNVEPPTPTGTPLGLLRPGLSSLPAGQSYSSTRTFEDGVDYSRPIVGPVNSGTGSGVAGGHMQRWSETSTATGEGSVFDAAGLYRWMDG
ncbi:hypothetical protein FB45DRAFT_906361 [Roridomyces roridus]|uniref:Transmembrane protein n=1 Tax=Roridomyces roridus TaxID=1738132 RepID=A0AAD7C112_9AGAR|nr:hypothetical protein FB45DRAFT_906361 [Roridomyces roridus]